MAENFPNMRKNTNFNKYSWYLMAQTIICLQCRKSRFDLWVRKTPWRREWLTHCSILALRILRTEEPGRVQSIGFRIVGHNWAINTFTFFTANPNQDKQIESHRGMSYSNWWKPNIKKKSWMQPEKGGKKKKRRGKTHHVQRNNDKSGYQLLREVRRNRITSLKYLEGAHSNNLKFYIQ